MSQMEYLDKPQKQSAGEGNDLRERKENKELMLGEFNHKWTQMGTKVG